MQAGPARRHQASTPTRAQKFEGKVESLSGGTGASFSLLPADNASGNFVKVVQRVPVRIAWINAPGRAVARRPVGRRHRPRRETESS